MTPNTKYRPDFSSGRIDVPDVGGVLIDFADRQANRTDKGLDRALKQQQLAEEQRRWDISNARAEAEWNRKQQEQKSVDAYYDILANGPQTKGGVLNTQALISESSKYDLTPEEIELTKTIRTPEQARAAGNEQLANKLTWQQNLSNFVDQNYTNEALQESRPEMYERAMGKVRGQGLPVLPGMIDKRDTAKLEEVEARKLKLKDITDQEAEIAKRQREEEWKVVNAIPGKTSVDAAGNIVDVPSAKEVNNYNKDADTSILKIQDAVSGLGLDSSEKKLAAIEEADRLVKKLVAGGVPSDTAATLVTNELKTKETNPILSYIGLGNKVPNYNTAMVDAYANDLINRYKSTAGSTAQNVDNPRLNAALTIADSNRISDAATLAKLKAQKDALGDPTALRSNKVDELLRSQGILPTATTSQNTSVVGTSKMPQSLVQAEGVRNEPYKDSKGIVTVGIGYAFNKDRSEIESDFKAAGIPLSKIDGLMKQDGTKLTNQEVAALGDVAYDRHGVQKLNKLGIDINTINPTLAEIGVAQAYRGDIVKGGEGYRGKLYEFLKNDDLVGMTNYVKSSKEVPKEVKQRMALVTDRFGAITREQATYEGIPTGTSKNSVQDLFNKSTTDKTDWNSYSTKEINDIKAALDPTNNADKAILADIDKQRAGRLKYKGEEIDLNGRSLLSRFDDYVKSRTYNEDGTINNLGTAGLVAETGLALTPFGRYSGFGKPFVGSPVPLGRTLVRSDAQIAAEHAAVGRAAEAREVARLEQEARNKYLQELNKPRPSADKIKEARELLNERISKIQNRALDRRIIDKEGANDYLATLVNKQKLGLISREELLSEARMLNDTGLINTRTIMEALAP